jgi:hypothetical protein
MFRSPGASLPRRGIGGVPSKLDRTRHITLTVYTLDRFKQESGELSSFSLTLCIQQRVKLEIMLRPDKSHLLHRVNQKDASSDKTN